MAPGDFTYDAVSNLLTKTNPRGKGNDSMNREMDEHNNHVGRLIGEYYGSGGAGDRLNHLWNPITYHEGAANDCLSAAMDGTLESIIDPYYPALEGWAALPSPARRPEACNECA